MHPTAPLLDTPRLRLRAHGATDFPGLAALWADPAVVRFIGNKPSTRDESWSRLLRYAGHWALLGFGFWAVERKSDGAYVGDVGLADWKRDLTPPLDGMPEAGWVLRPDAHGAGIASEALAAVLGWADRHLPDRTTCCIVSAEHAASIRVAEKAGYRIAARAAFRGDAIVQMRRTPSGATG